MDDLWDFRELNRIRNERRNWKNMFDSMCRRDDGKQFIQFLIDARLDLNSLNKYGTTMLSLATECGNLEIVEFLVEKGADPNVENSDSSQPIHVAAKHGHPEIVKFYLNIGICVNIRDNIGYTPLHYVTKRAVYSAAVRSCYQQVVHILLNSQADLNAVDKKAGYPPLLHAARNSDKDLVELFIQVGANINCCDENQFSVLHHCSVNGWTDIVLSLVEGEFNIDLNESTPKGDTPLLLAASCVHKDLVELFIRLEVKMDVCCSKKWTILHHSCANGWTDLVRSLTERDIDINARTTSGATPLLIAAAYTHEDTVKLLIDLGADFELKDLYNRTLLHFVSERGMLDIVKYLVTMGCDFNAKSVEGHSPFNLAVRYSYISVIEHFIDSGADLNCMDINEKTPVHYACIKGRLDIVTYLVSKGCDLTSETPSGETPLILAVKHSHLNLVNYLVDSGADVNSWDKNKKTVLHFACKSGMLEIVEALMKKGPNLNIQDNSRLDTPLHIAVKFSRLDFVKLFLRAGADCNIQNAKGISAFQYLLTSPFCLEGIVCFLENGAYFQSKDYIAVRKKPVLKRRILQDANLCQKALMNKFNADLHKVYEIPTLSNYLPPIHQLKIVNNTVAAQDIAQSVRSEIAVKGFCNIVKVRPKTLVILSVEALKKYYT